MAAPQNMKRSGPGMCEECKKRRILYSFRPEEEVMVSTLLCGMPVMLGGYCATCASKIRKTVLGRTR